MMKLLNSIYAKGLEQKYTKCLCWNSNLLSYGVVYSINLCDASKSNNAVW